LVPILNNIIQMGDLVRKPGFPVQPLVLILAPTRELAIQIVTETKDYCRGTPFENSIHLICGGKGMEAERQRLLASFLFIFWLMLGFEVHATRMTCINRFLAEPALLCRRCYNWPFNGLTQARHD